MDHTLERSPIEPEEALFVDIIRPLVRYYWLLLSVAIAGALSLLGVFYLESDTYTTEGVMVLDGSYANHQLILDLLSDQGTDVKMLSGGLIKLTLTTKNPEDAARRLNDVMKVTHARLMSLLPDYESEIELAKEQLQGATLLINEAKTLEERIILSDMLVETLRAINSLSERNKNKENALRVVKAPGAPVELERPDMINRLGLGGAFGLMLGSLGAYILYNRAAILRLRRAV